jgi:hypothetical protein
MGDRVSRLGEAVHLHRTPPRPGGTARHLFSAEPQAASAHLPEGLAQGGRDLTGVRLRGEGAGVEDALRRAGAPRPWPPPRRPTPPRAGYQDRFTRITWENLYVLAGLRWRRLGRLQEYMLLKTVRLAPAFHLDIG